MADAAADTPPWWYVWLGEPIDWKKFSEPAPPGSYKPQVWDLRYGAACTLLMLLLQVCIDFVTRPLGRRLGLSDKKVNVSAKFREKASVLEPHFRQNRRPNAESLRQLSQQLGFSENSIDNWFRQRRNKDKPSQLVRFTECVWQTLFYSGILAFGVAVQYREPYFWDSDETYRGWPRHYTSPQIFWYYMLQLGFYCSSLLTLAFDMKRKDFLEMSVHHVVTVVLVVLSWSLNFTRMGALTLVIHDAVDPLLNISKLVQQAGFPVAAQGVFCAFYVVWIVTRLVVLPLRVVYPAYADCLRLSGARRCLPYYIIIGGLFVLQLLHCVWTYFISIIFINGFRRGADSMKDFRSDSEISDNDGSKKD